MKRPTLTEDPINHINSFFREQGLPYTVEDVIRQKDRVVGKRHLSMKQQIDELGGVPSRSTLYLWHMRLPKM